MNLKAPTVTFISLGDIRALGIRILSAVLKGRGIHSNIIWYKVDYSERHIPTRTEENLLIDLIKQLNTDIVAISVKTPFVQRAKDITRRVRNEAGAMVIWGGSHPTVMPDDCMEHADAICIGEGEYSLVELVELAFQGATFERTPNIWARKDGIVFRNPIRPLLQTRELDALPFPDCGGEGKHVIDRDHLKSEDPISHTIEYFAMASRGCPFKCSFCINSLLKDIYKGCGSLLRVRSPQNVVDEIVDLVGRFPGIKRIRFQDEVFPRRPDWLEVFCEQYRRRVGLQFLCTFHPQTVDEVAIRMLKEAGLIVVGLGMQSPSERIRKEVFHRPETNQRLLEAINILHRQRVNGFYDIILDNPFETEKDRQRGLDFLLTVPKPFNLFSFSLRFFPGYPITKEALGKNLIERSEVEEMETRGYFEMGYDWHSPRKKEDLFWNCLYILASRSCVPRLLVKAASRSGFLRKYPSALIWLVKITWGAELIIIGTRRLVRRQMNPLSLLRVAKARLSKETI